MKKVVISLLMIVLLLLTSCSGKEIIITDSIYAFGTTIEITLGASNGTVDEVCQIMKETITSKEDRDVVAKIEFRDA